jgi:hypothetical protein
MSSKYQTLILKATHKQLNEVQWDINLQIVDEILKNPDDVGPEILKLIMQRFKTDEDKQIFYCLTVKKIFIKII